MSKFHPINKQAIHLTIAYCAGGILLSILAIIVLGKCDLKDYIIIPTVFISVACSIMASAIYSYMIDMQRELEDFRKLIIGIVTSNEFLKELDDPQLSTLRSDAITQLNVKGYPNMQQGLIDLDKEIFNTLKMPYYETFRETQQYEYDVTFDWGDGTQTSCIRKTHRLEYLLKSPKGKTTECKANVGIRKAIYCPPELDVQKMLPEIIKLKKFTVNIDDTRDYNIRDSLVMSYSDQEPCEYYNKRVNIHLPCGESLAVNVANVPRDRVQIEEVKDIHNNIHGIDVTFKEEVKVEIEYDIFIPIEDINYTNRLKYPAKSYRIDCYCKQPGMKFYGQILGTFTKQSKISMNSTEDSFSLESYDWLLPRNGVYIVLIKN